MAGTTTATTNCDGHLLNFEEADEWHDDDNSENDDEFTTKTNATKTTAPTTAKNECDDGSDDKSINYG